MEVLERFAQGDLEAFEGLFRHLQGEVYGCIVRIHRDRVPLRPHSLLPRLEALGRFLQRTFGNRVRGNTMEIGVSFQELMHYADSETRHWHGFFQQHARSVDLEVGIAGAKDIRGLIVHIFAVELRYAERLLGATPTPYEQLPTGSLDEIFGMSDTGRQKIKQYLTQASDADLKTVLTFETRTAGTLSSSKRKIVAHTLLHSTRHWAQVATALRQHGYKQDWQHDFIFTDALE